MDPQLREPGYGRPEYESPFPNICFDAWAFSFGPQNGFRAATVAWLNASRRICVEHCVCVCGIFAAIVFQTQNT